MGAIICYCGEPISDISDCNMGLLSPDAYEADCRHSHTVYECSACGALNISWQVWPDGEEKRVTYLPADGKWHGLVQFHATEFYHEPELVLGLASRIVSALKRRWLP